ncbi:hypothetical protein [Chryseobacterium sp. Mn2064]|uniref:hypothetical protein n=1 Tax=Chryseobacterium sp. Mn2064 TaxID=3395263 RepID=UPI003BC50D23
MQINSTERLLKIAQEYVLKTVGDHVEVIFTEDHDELFMFYYQAKDKKVRLVGQGPIIIVKNDKRIFEYGSGTSDEEALVDVTHKLNKERLIRLYYKNYDIWQNYYVWHKRYHLIITEIYEEDLDQVISLLLKNRIQYRITDENQERSYNYYTQEQLVEKFQKKPITLEDRFCYNHFSDVLAELIIKHPHCRFTLSE